MSTRYTGGIFIAFALQHIAPYAESTNYISQPVNLIAINNLKASQLSKTLSQRCRHPTSSIILVVLVIIIIIIILVIIGCMLRST